MGWVRTASLPVPLVLLSRTCPLVPAPCHGSALGIKVTAGAEERTELRGYGHAGSEKQPLLQ